MEHARAHGVPGILEVNSPLIDEQATHRDLVDRTAAERVARRVFRAASLLVAVSEGVADWVERFRPSDPVLVAPNGVDPSRFAPPAARGGAAPFTVGFVGTLRPWHGIDVLADAFARLAARAADARLLVVGGGPGREDLERDLAARGLLERVRLVGAVAPEEVPALLAAMDVGVAPYPETAAFYFSPLKIFEYMAAGLPVVASRIGQIGALVEHDRTGMLCTAGDAQALAETLDGLRRDPERRRRLGTAAREQALRRHTWDGVVQGILEGAGLATPVRVSTESV
jgi:glycosyltransferase involved in cell wall biosynthesis